MAILYDPALLGLARSREFDRSRWGNLSCDQDLPLLSRSLDALLSRSLDADLSRSLDNDLFRLLKVLK